MTDRNIYENRANTKIEECLNELNKILRQIDHLTELTAHLEHIQQSSEIEETRSLMLIYHVQLVDEMSSVVRRGREELCM